MQDRAGKIWKSSQNWIAEAPADLSIIFEWDEKVKKCLQNFEDLKKNKHKRILDEIKLDNKELFNYQASFR